MPREKPRYALITEGKHPGYSDYLVVSDEKGILELAQSLERLSHLSNGARVDFRIGDRSKFGRDGSLSFAKCADEKLDDLVTRSFRPRDAGGWLLVSVGMLVFLVGCVYSIKHAMAVLGWLFASL